MGDDMVGLDFQALADKAKKITDRRAALQAQESALKTQVEDLQSQLVSDYGENYMDAFKEAVGRIQQWDQAHA